MKFRVRVDADVEVGRTSIERLGFGAAAGYDERDPAQLVTEYLGLTLASMPSLTVHHYGISVVEVPS